MREPAAVPRRSLTVGLDLGQRADFSAYAVVEGWRERQPGQARSESFYAVRALDRLPLGTNYLDVAARVRRVVSAARLRAGASGLTLYVDGTGVGGAVLDILRAADIKAAIMPCFFTGTDRLAEVRAPAAPGTRPGTQGRVVELRIGKAWMVGRLQVLLQGRRLRIAGSLPSAAAVREELLAYDIRVSQDGADTYGAFATGAHDDMVVAVGLATVREPAGDPAEFVRMNDELRGLRTHGLGSLPDLPTSWPRSW